MLYPGAGAGASIPGATLELFDDVLDDGERAADLVPSRAPLLLAAAGQGRR